MRMSCKELPRCHLPKHNYSPGDSTSLSCCMQLRGFSSRRLIQEITFRRAGGSPADDGGGDRHFGETHPKPSRFLVMMLLELASPRTRDPALSSCTCLCAGGTSASLKHKQNEMEKGCSEETSQTEVFLSELCSLMSQCGQSKEAKGWIFLRLK